MRAVQPDSEQAVEVPPGHPFGEALELRDPCVAVGMRPDPLAEQHLEVAAADRVTQRLQRHGAADVDR